MRGMENLQDFWAREEELRQFEAIFFMAFHPKMKRAHAAQRQIGLVG